MGNVTATIPQGRGMPIPPTDEIPKFCNTAGIIFVD